MADKDTEAAVVGGVDTHKDLHVAAVVDENNKVLGTRYFSTTRQGYRQMLAWNTPGEDFSGELKLEGLVTSSRNPWVWKVGQGNEGLEVKQSRGVRDGGKGIPVALPAMTVLLGKNTLTTPAGCEGLSPRVSYGKGAEGFSLVWTAPGMAEVTLSITGDNNARAGTFVFRMQAVGGGVCHVNGGQLVYAGVYDDLNVNGLLGESTAMKASDIPGDYV